MQTASNEELKTDLKNKVYLQLNTYLFNNAAFDVAFEVIMPFILGSIKIYFGNTFYCNAPVLQLEKELQERKIRKT